ncbi:hypothetical protein HKI87_04g33800 [Chloropicon roscoffensis]|uniref:BHLH domain-containing protein n=1 Tax=Chloropicon roscoffensis TaxID=1461544 RepID=A0AAX4P733_9CHLO
MMETTTAAATTTGREAGVREAEEGTSSRETLENHPGNAGGSRATEDLQEARQQLPLTGSALGGQDGIVVDASNPVVAHTPAARSLAGGKDPVSKVLGGGVAKALKPTSTAAARSEKKRRNEIRRRIDVLRTMLPDTVRNKNVIEVLDDTILLINNLRDMVSQANSQLAATRNNFSLAAAAASGQSSFALAQHAGAQPGAPEYRIGPMGFPVPAGLTAASAEQQQAHATIQAYLTAQQQQGAGAAAGLGWPNAAASVGSIRFAPTPTPQQQAQQQTVQEDTSIFLNNREEA